VSSARSATLIGVRPEDTELQATLPASAAVGGESGACANSPDLTGLDEQQVRAVLVGQTTRFVAGFQRWMEGHAFDGMSYVRLRLLETLHCDGPAIMRDLGTQLGASPRNMTAMVDALEQAGLVARRPHPTDRRATLVELSPAGARAAAQAIGPQLDAMAEIFSGFSPQECEQFSALLAELTSAIRAREGSCGERG
jgi:DNA-binding MarR family transcriptional regulator